MEETLRTRLHDLLSIDSKSREELASNINFALYE